MQVTKGHKRMWYSIMPPIKARGWDAEQLKRLDANAWVWAKKDHQKDHPPPLPAYVYWEQNEWRRWIESVAGLTV